MNENMRYFNIEIQISKDGQGEETVATAIYDKGAGAAGLEAATIANHTALASMRASVDAGTLYACCGLVINQKGGTEIKPEYYSKEPAPAEAPAEA